MFTTNEYQASYYPSTPWIYNTDSNYHSLLGYIRNLINMRSKLLVIRVDLGFRAHSQGSYNAEYAREKFNRFMNNRRRNSIFANEIGYAWALEFGNNGQMKSSGKGFHYHCIFFFDGHKSNHDIMSGMVSQVLGNVGSYAWSQGSKYVYDLCTNPVFHGSKTGQLML